MKTTRFILNLAALIGVVFTAELEAQPTAFTYQGQLTENGVAATGLYDFECTLHDSSGGVSVVGGPLTNNATLVSNGLFTVALDFGAGAFDGSDRWLEIGVVTNGGGAFTVLSPRQQITSAPYAVRALNLGSNALSGFVGPVSFSNPANSFSGAFSGDGSSLSNLNVTTLDGLSASNFWQLGGNVGTTAGTHFLGTTDNQPLEFKVNNQRVLRLESTVGPPNVIAGSSGNEIEADTVGATVGGGGAVGFINVIHDGSHYSTISGGVENSISNDAPYAVIGGGYRNSLATNTDGAVIGGGIANSIWQNAQHGLIAGGYSNSIAANSDGAVIGGGSYNEVAASTLYSAVAGGYYNAIRAGSSFTFVGGGLQNDVASGSPFSVVGGGLNNQISSSALAAVIGGGTTNAIFADAASVTISGGADNSVDNFSSYSVIGGGSQNRIDYSSTAATIAGGQDNDIGFFAVNSTVSGGQNNNIGQSSYGSTISGGSHNNIFVGAEFGTIGGGENNQIQNLSLHGVVAGGSFNIIEGAASWSTIGGGFNNLIRQGAKYSTIPGGRLNFITNNADYAFAAGRFARVDHQGVFMWADSTDALFHSDRADQFKVRASGGMYLQAGSSGLNPAALRVECTTSSGVAIHANQTSSDSTVVIANRGTGDLVRCFSGPTAAALVFRVYNDGDVSAKSYATWSDRNAKEKVRLISSAAVLEQVAALPISEWSFKGDKIRHIGPMAQDFYAAFGVGPDDKHITTVDADGVALAAIQGLNQKLERENAELRAELQEIKQLLSKLTKKGSQ